MNKFLNLSTKDLKDVNQFYEERLVGCISTKTSDIDALNSEIEETFSKLKKLCASMPLCSKCPLHIKNASFGEICCQVGRVFG